MGGAVELRFTRKRRRRGLGNTSDRSTVPSSSLLHRSIFLLAIGWTHCFSFLYDHQYQWQRSNIIAEGFSVVVHNRYKSSPSLGIAINDNHQNYPARTVRQSRYVSFLRVTTTDINNESFATNTNNEKVNDTTNDLGRNYTKSHSLTVCIVPPPPLLNKSGTNAINQHYNETTIANTTNCAWDVLTKLRVELRDPGLYRWPPHVNLLYPFVRDDTNTSLTKLLKAAKNVEPFWVLLDLSTDSSSSSSNSSETTTNSTKGFGTFGSSTRGVLWVYPESFRNSFGTTTKSSNSTTIEPIVELQSLLEDEFPMCSESLKNRSFLPHLTLSSKFDSLQDAREAETSLVQPTKLCFWCQEFYLLERDGEHGQFRKKATIPLGNANSNSSCSNSNSQQQPATCVHDPPLGFLGMPETEEDWIKSELQALKARRKANRIDRPRGRTRKSYRARRREKKIAAAAAAAEQEAANNNNNNKNVTRHDDNDDDDNKFVL